MPSAHDRRRPAWYSRLGIGLVLCLSVIALAAAQEDQGLRPARQDGPAESISARVDRGLLTLQVDGAPLAEVLRAIGEAGSFRVVLRGAFATPVHESFADRPLDEAIGRLVGDHFLVTTRGQTEAANGTRALAELRVIEQRANAPARDEPISSSFEIPDLPMHPILDLGPPTYDHVVLGLSDPDQTIRMTAVPLVASLSPQQAIQVLAQALANEDDLLVRSRGVAALTRLQTPGATTLLRQRALHDVDPELRMQALNALAAVSETAAARSAETRVTSVLGQSLRLDREPQVRLTAIRALQRVGSQRARADLQQAAADLDPDVVAAAERALTAWQEEVD